MGFVGVNVVSRLGSAVVMARKDGVSGILEDEFKDRSNGDGVTGRRRWNGDGNW